MSLASTEPLHEGEDGSNVGARAACPQNRLRVQSKFPLLRARILVNFRVQLPFWKGAYLVKKLHNAMEWIIGIYLAIGVLRTIKKIIYACPSKKPVWMTIEDNSLAFVLYFTIYVLLWPLTTRK